VLFRSLRPMEQSDRDAARPPYSAPGSRNHELSHMTSRYRHRRCRRTMRDAIAADRCRVLMIRHDRLLKWRSHGYATGAPLHHFNEGASNSGSDPSHGVGAPPRDELPLAETVVWLTRASLLGRRRNAASAMKNSGGSQPRRPGVAILPNEPIAESHPPCTCRSSRYARCRLRRT